jgi:hypothetical protein
MSRGSRAELERLVQVLERKHPEWSASRIEAELEILAPVDYGYWKDNTPVPRARHRQVQRWRTGDKGTVRRSSVRPPFQYVWPVGERQRHALDPEFQPRATGLRASHRIFVHNCSEETLREVRVRLGDREVAYEPAMEPGKLTEIHWVKNDAIRAAALAAVGHERIPHDLQVEFAFSKGLKIGHLEGELTMDATEGWTSFTSGGGVAKEIE